jgi:hypothetical protein
MERLETMYEIQTEKLANSSRNRSRRRAGVTIVEVMMALTVFALFTTGTCKLLISHRKVLDMSRDHYIAANLAKDRLELARTFEFNQIHELAESQILLDGSGIPSLNGNFRRTTQISSLSSNLYELAITVDIRNRASLEFAPAKESINTYIAKKL